MLYRCRLGWRADHHPRAAGRAAQHAEPCEQPFRLRPPAARRAHPLHLLPGRRRRRSPGARRSLTSSPKRSSPRTSATSSIACDAVEAALDPVRRAGTRGPRVTVAPLARSSKASRDDRRLVGCGSSGRRRADGSRAGCSGTVRTPSRDRAALRVAGPLGGHPAMVFGDQRRASSRRASGAAVSVRDLADVDREDRAAGALDPLDDLAPAPRASGRAGRSRRRRRRPPRRPRPARRRDEPGGCSSGAPPDTSSSSNVSTSSSPSRLARVAAIRSRCSDGRRRSPSVAEPRDADDADGTTRGGAMLVEEGAPHRTSRSTTDSGETVTLSSLEGSASSTVFLPQGRHARLHGAGVRDPRRLRASSSARARSCSASAPTTRRRT